MEAVTEEDLVSFSFDMAQKLGLVFDFELAYKISIVSNVATRRPPVDYAGGRGCCDAICVNVRHHIMPPPLLLHRSDGEFIVLNFHVGFHLRQRLV